MDWKCVRIDGKGYANTTYISKFHPHIPAGRIFQKKWLPAAAARNPADWDVGMEFGDAGCVRISFAINSNPFSAHSRWKSIKSYFHPIEKAIHPQNEFSLLG